MPRKNERLPLMFSSPGTERYLTLYRYGSPDAGPKAYLQASLHADEVPALLVQHHLIGLLDKAAAAGEITGQIVIVPYANPIGLDQFVNGYHLGRYDMLTGGNYNRSWPQLFDSTAQQLDGKLTADAKTNTDLVRRALRHVIDERLEALDRHRLGAEVSHLKLLLAREAVDSDLVLDLHCDLEAEMHLFLIPAHWPEAQDIAAELGCRAVLLAEDSGGASFDESFSTPWIRLAARFPDYPIPPACLSGTVELRGRGDVSDELAASDAHALFRILQRRGFVDSDPGALPAPSVEATRLDAVDVIRAPAVGVLTYKVALGDEVRSGDVIAEIVDPAAEPGSARTPVRSATDGFVLSRHVHHFVTSGMSVAKVVGREPLPHRAEGDLLED